MSKLTWWATKSRFNYSDLSQLNKNVRNSLFAHEMYEHEMLLCTEARLMTKGQRSAYYGEFTAKVDYKWCKNATIFLNGPNESKNISYLTYTSTIPKYGCPYPAILHLFF